MNQALVVLTYPEHFFLTFLTVRSFLQFHPKTKDIKIIVDDISDKIWPNYEQDCKTYYGQHYGAHIIKASDAPVLKKFANNGWVRQQMIKLYLDQLVDCPQCFFTDGDIVFLHSVNVNHVPYSVPTLDQHTDQINSYVNRVLGIDHAGITVGDQQVCVSNPAFRFIDCDMLPRLRNHVVANTGQDFSDLHQDIGKNNTASISEWELMENFKTHLQKKPLELVQYAPHDFSALGSPLDFFPYQFVTGYCTDAQLGHAWLESQGVSDLEPYWHHG